MRDAVAGRVLDVAAALIIVAFAALHLIDMGRLSFTWDESTDTGTVACLTASRDPFACLNEPQQSRLPFYLHSLAGLVRSGELPHYLLSAAFSIFNIIVAYAFARKEFGRAAATLTVALFATSLPMLASGRMLLTHSNVIFTTFTILTVILFYRFVETSNVRFLHGSAVALGLGVASSLLGLFVLLILVPLYLSTRSDERPLRRSHVSFPLIAALVFFISTIIYMRPDVFASAVRGTLQGHQYWFWNIFEQGPESPWWFSLLLLVVKIGPWWMVLLLITLPIYVRRAEGGNQKKFFLSFLAGFLGYLVIKSALFYDAPHHHVAFYPFLYLFMAVSFVFAMRTRVKSMAMVLLVGCSGLQLYDVWSFFPNYLFYGSQYGQRFIGEFYGPAVFHAQDKDPINERIDSLIRERPDVEILVADNNALERTGRNFVPFTRRDPQKKYEFAFVDRLYARHFHFPERDEFNRLLARDYEAETTHQFPRNVWSYKLLRLRAAR